MNPISGSTPTALTSQLPQKLEDLKQKYNDLSPEEQNSVQNNALDKRADVVETRQENKDQLRSAAVGVYSNQLAKSNAELFINLSTDQDTELSSGIPPAAAADVYKSVQRSTLVNSDLYQNNINSVIENRNQPPQVQPEAPAEPVTPAETAPEGTAKPQTLDAFV